MRKLSISIAQQSLELTEDGELIRRYPVSTSKHGVGEQHGSFKTPRGQHIVRAKIGVNEPLGAVFVGRRPTGEVYTPELAAQQPGRDWILTRILWLSGKEVGFNRLGECDTMRRYIYIHGAPDAAVDGAPGSIGCVRMRNADVAELFNLIEPGTEVEIVE